MPCPHTLLFLVRVRHAEPVDAKVVPDNPCQKTRFVGASKRLGHDPPTFERRGPVVRNFGRVL